MLATEALKEADRIMTICNACRYCEGVCAVFPAMETRRSFTAGDLNYLANLCHSCGACYFDCQFSPPHEFNLNVPRTFAQVRNDSYKSYAWPQALAPIFERNGLWISLLTAASVAIYILGFVAWHQPDALFGIHTGPGAFYRLMPHNTMVVLFGAAFLYAIVAMVMGFRSFWTDIGEAKEPLPEPKSFWQAMKDISTLRYLDGGGDGCRNENDVAPDNRKLYHHLTFYGFLLCFASTSVATLYHYVGGWHAPYAWYDLPVIMGSLGGIGLIIGPIGLLIAKTKRDPLMQDTPRLNMDVAFIAMLLLTSVTGLLLLLLRQTPAMGLMLAIHLGVVFSLFITMPYSKFVHGLYRFGALLRFAKDTQSGLKVVE